MRVNNARQRFSIATWSILYIEMSVEVARMALKIITSEPMQEIVIVSRVGESCSPSTLFRSMREMRPDGLRREIADSKWWDFWSTWLIVKSKYFIK